jgi:hypothetical protein
MTRLSFQVSSSLRPRSEAVLTAYPPIHIIVGLACAYEAAAIFTRKMPTISALQKQHPIVAFLICGWLAWHFARYESPQIVLTEALVEN